MARVKSDVGRYAMVPEWLLDTHISSTAVRLFAVLAAKYADRDTAEAHPRRRTLAGDIGASVDTVDRALKELETVGAVTVEARNTDEGDRDSNTYTLAYARPGSRTDAVTPYRTDAAGGSRTDAVALIQIPDHPESSDPAPIPIARARAQGKGARAPESMTETLKDQAYRALYALRSKCVMESLPPRNVELDLRDWSEVLLLPDVVRIEEELGGKYDWNYARAIIGSKARARSDGRDPWADRSAVSNGRADRGNARPGGIRTAGGGRRPQGDVAGAWEAELATRRAEAAGRGDRSGGDPPGVID